MSQAEPSHKASQLDDDALAKAVEAAHGVIPEMVGPMAEGYRQSVRVAVETYLDATAAQRVDAERALGDLLGRLHRIPAEHREHVLGDSLPEA